MERRTFCRYGLMMTALGYSRLSLGVELKKTSHGEYRNGARLPQVLQEIYPANFAGHLVVAGGFSGLGPLPYPVRASHWFNPEDQQWLEGPELPYRLHHPYLVSHENRLWALGGYRFSYLNPWQMQSGCYSLSSIEDDWQETVSLPARRGEFAAGSTAQGLVVTAGRKPIDDSPNGANGQYEDHTNAADTWLFDGERWQTAAPIPTPRNSVGTAVVEQKLHVIGGRQVVKPGVQHNITQHEVYDPQSDRWEVRAPLPMAQAGCAAASVGDDIYVFGGEQFTSPKRVFANAWVYSAQSDSWTPLPDMPVPVHGHGAVALGKNIHIIGGGEEVSAGKTSDQHTVFDTV